MPFEPLFIPIPKQPPLLKSSGGGGITTRRTFQSEPLFVPIEQAVLRVKNVLGGIGKAVARAPFRAGATLGADIGGRAIIPTEETGKVGRFLLGEEPIEALTAKGGRYAGTLETKGIPPELASLLGGTGAAFITGLDVTPVGGGKKEVAKGVIGKIPKSLEPLAQEAKKYKSAEEFVKNVGENDQILYRGRGVMTPSKAGLKQPIFLSPSEELARSYTLEGKGKVSAYVAKSGKTLDLTDFKTSKEFYLNNVLGKTRVNEINKVLDNMEISRYGDVNQKTFMERAGKIFPDKDEKYLINLYIDAANTKQFSPNVIYNNWDKVINYAQKSGYDYVAHTGEDFLKTLTAKEIVAINPEKSLTKLTDFYKEATKGVNGFVKPRTLVKVAGGIALGATGYGLYQSLKAERHGREEERNIAQIINGIDNAKTPEEINKILDGLDEVEDTRVQLELRKYADQKYEAILIQDLTTSF